MATCKRNVNKLRIGHKNLHVWTHDIYTKVLGCKTWNSWPPMYTWIIKIAIDVAKQVIWPLYKSHDIPTHFMMDLSIAGDYLIINNIFLDNAYELSTCLFKFIDQIK